MALTELCQDVRGVAQVGSDVGSDVGGRCQTPSSLYFTQAEIRRSSQRLDATDGVAPSEDPACRCFELGRHRLIRLDS